MGVFAILVQFLSDMSREAAKKVRNADPDERQKMANTMAEFLTTSSLLLAESPALREAFAKVHSEFLKFPEAGGTITDAVSAYEKFVPKGAIQDSYQKESLGAYSFNQER